LYPHHHGCTANNDILDETKLILPEHLRDPDYRSGYIGKWHLGNETIQQRGFDEWISIEDYYLAETLASSGKVTFSDYHHFLQEKGVKTDYEKNGYGVYSREYAASLPESLSKPAFIADQACRFIQENHDQPFVLYVNFLEPHPPYNSAYDDLYDPADVDLPPRFLAAIGDDLPLRQRQHHYGRFIRRMEGEIPDAEIQDEDSWRKLIARYWGAVSLVDTHVGRILAALRDCGVDQDTIVVFTSDHGDHMGDFGMVGKTTMFEASLKVPLMIRIPGVTDQQRVIENPICLVDLVPTLLELMGKTPASEVDGTSRAPELLGAEPFQLNDIFMEWVFDRYEGNTGVVPADRSEVIQSIGVNLRAVLSEGRWKFIMADTGEHELFDLIEDPYEEINLYGLGEYEDKSNQLRQCILNWQQSTCDEWEAWQHV
jgi:arylsulfatase A-like enzyme